MAGEKTIWNLTAVLGMDIKDFNNKLAESKGKSQTFTSELGKQFGSLGKTIAGALSVTAIAGFIASTYKMYAEDKKQEAMLLAALKGRKDVQEQLVAQQKRLMGSTLYSKDDIENSQLYAASLGLTSKQIQDLLAASVQLASATGGELLDTTKQLGKTLGGNLGRMGQMIPALKDMTKAQLEHGDAIKYVIDKYGGIAEAGANSPLGVIDQLSKSWTEFKKSFGETIAPAITPSLTGLSEYFKILQDDLLTFSDKFNLIMGGYGGHSGFAKTMEEFHKYNLEKNAAAGDYMKGLTGAITGGMGTTPVKSVEELTTESGKAAKALEELKKKWDAFWSPKNKEINWPEAQMRDTFGNISTFDQMAGPIPEGPTSGPYTDLGNFLTNAAKNPNPNGNLSPIQPISPELFNIPPENLDKLKTGLKTITGGVVDLTNEIEGGLIDAIGSLSEGFGEMLAGVGTGADMFKVVGKSIGKFLMSVGTALVAYGMAMDAFKKAFANPYVAIAAGVALIIAGSALSALAGKGPSGMASGGGGGGGGGGYFTYSPSVLPNTNGQAMDITVHGKISGNAIYLANNRGENYYNNVK